MTIVTVMMMITIIVLIEALVPIADSRHRHDHQTMLIPFWDVL